MFDVDGPSRHTRLAHDQVALAADVFRPDAPGAVPTVLIHTPYEASLSGTWEDVWAVQEMVPRGYALVIAHARGTGGSGGCNDYYGPQERADGAGWVEWIRDQEWSDGRVGALGHSYSGGTALILATAVPEGLEAVAAVAGVTNPYHDLAPGGAWGVGTTTEPASYTLLEAAYDPGEMPAEGACHGVALPGIGALGVYDDFFAQRNWTQAAADVEAPVLMVHGQADDNVGFGNLADFFPRLQSTKAALVGPWDHTAMLDTDGLTTAILAWFHEHLPANGSAAGGLPPGFGRHLQEWPPTHDWEGSWNGTAFGAEAGDATWQVGGPLDAPLRLPVGALDDAAVAGRANLAFTATLQDPSTVFHARLGCDAEGGVQGHLNALLHESRNQVTPVTPGEPVRFTLTFEPLLGRLSPCTAVWLDTSLPPREMAGTADGAPVTIVSSPDDPVVLTVPVEEGT